MFSVFKYHWTFAFMNKLWVFSRISLPTQKWKPTLKLGLKNSFKRFDIQLADCILYPKLKWRQMTVKDFTRWITEAKARISTIPGNQTEATLSLEQGLVKLNSRNWKQMQLNYFVCTFNSIGYGDSVYLVLFGTIMGIEEHRAMSGLVVCQTSWSNRYIF